MSTNELRTGGPCPRCNGTGWYGADKYRACPDCGGTGKVVDVDFHGVEPRQDYKPVLTDNDREEGDGYTMLFRNPHPSELSPLNDLSFQMLTAACIARQNELDPKGVMDELFFAVELGGEAGEALNFVKKLVRAKIGILPTSATTDDLAAELADVVITAQNLAIKYGIDLGLSVREKFNYTSVKRGLSGRL